MANTRQVKTRGRSDDDIPVELRGLEPLEFPAETCSELRLLLIRCVTCYVRVLAICVGVLRDVTVLGDPAPMLLVCIAAVGM